MSLRDDVEELLPNWENWYPSLFDAAVDLGLIRSRICSMSELTLSSRHQSITDAAKADHRERWGGKDENPMTTRQARRRRK